MGRVGINEDSAYGRKLDKTCNIEEMWGDEKSPCVQEAKVEEPSYLRQQSNPQGHEHEGWNELLVRGSVEMIPFSVVCL